MPTSGSMIFRFDTYSQNEIPPFYLLNPDETPLYNLGSIYDRKVEWRYNTLSTFSFTAPYMVNGEVQDYYDSLKYRRLVNIKDFANFMITGIETNGDGINELKTITCQSLEVVFAYKKLSLFQGTYTFNNVLSGSGVSTKNLMNELIAYVPGWTLGTIDSTLKNITRSFDVTDKTLYDFMMNDVSQTFQCIFVFDSLEKTVSAYSLANATTPTDIFISFDTLLKSFKVTESTDELATALNVLGGDGITINYVNPLGSNVIYNFDYYKTTEWMNQDLIDALGIWENKIAAYQPSYANLLTGLRIENGNLVTYESDLVTLQGVVSASVVVRDARVQQGLDITEISASIVVGESAVSAKEVQIVNEQATISAINAQLTSINSDLSFTNNFTSLQLGSLNNFIIGNTYTNTNFIATSLMSEVDVQNVSQELYDEAQVVLSKISQPRYGFELESANFLFLKDFETFISQIDMGCTITVELKDGVFTVPALLGIDFNYDNPEDFKLLLSNRLRLDDDKFQYTDLYGSTVDAGVTTNFNSLKWNNTSNDYTSVVGSGATLVGSTTLSNTNNLVLFSDTSGTRIKDGDALYLSNTSFAPTLVSSGATFTYNYNVGYYTIIGRMMTFELSISVSGISGTTSNQVYISMPILHKNISNLSASFRPSCGGITFGAGYTAICGILANNSSSIALYQEGTGVSLASLVASSLGATTTVIHLTGQYLIN